MFQHTAARRRLVFRRSKFHRLSSSFNTQPPEGGWRNCVAQVSCLRCFNTQPPEGGWICACIVTSLNLLVSTHSRPKAAGCGFCRLRFIGVVSTHSRPKAAGKKVDLGVGGYWFQHTAARRRLEQIYKDRTLFYRFNTQPPEGGWGFIDFT